VSTTTPGRWSSEDVWIPAQYQTVALSALVTRSQQSAQGLAVGGTADAATAIDAPLGVPIPLVSSGSGGAGVSAGGAWLTRDDLWSGLAGNGAGTGSGTSAGGGLAFAGISSSAGGGLTYGGSGAYGSDPSRSGVPAHGGSGPLGPLGDLAAFAGLAALFKAGRSFGRGGGDSGGSPLGDGASPTNTGTSGAGTGASAAADGAEGALDATGSDLAQLVGGDTTPGLGDAASSASRLARLDAIFAGPGDGDPSDPSDPWAAGGVLDESARVAHRPAVVVGDDSGGGRNFDPFGLIGKAWDDATGAARSTARDAAYALAETGNTAHFIATNEKTWDAAGQLARNMVDIPEGALGLALQMGAELIPGAGEGEEVRKLYARTEGKDLFGILGEIGTIKREAQHDAGDLGTALTVAEDGFALAGGAQIAVTGVGLVREGAALAREGWPAIRSALADLRGGSAALPDDLAAIAGDIGAAPEAAGYAARVNQITQASSEAERAEGLRVLVQDIARQKAELFASDITNARPFLKPGEWEALQRGDAMAANVGKAVENAVYREIRANPDDLGAVLKDTHISRDAETGRFMQSADLTPQGDLGDLPVIDIFSGSDRSVAAHAARSYRPLGATYDMPPANELKALTAVARGDAQWISDGARLAGADDLGSIAPALVPAVASTFVAGSEGSTPSEPPPPPPAFDIPTFVAPDPPAPTAADISERDTPREAPSLIDPVAPEEPTEPELPDIAASEPAAQDASVGYDWSGDFVDAPAEAA
jgi:hypothetical protein